MTVPYEIHEPQTEHFPRLHEFGLVRLGDRMVLVNRTRDGCTEVFENLVFHHAFGEPSLEMRAFSQEGLLALLNAAGFTEVRIYGDDYLPFGVAHAETWSLPVAARKGPYSLSRDATREFVTEVRDLRQKQDAETSRLIRSKWFRAGRKLGLF
jgi:hypothetical protein